MLMAYEVRFVAGVMSTQRKRRPIVARPRLGSGAARFRREQPTEPHRF
jgi:hypothetical protein